MKNLTSREEYMKHHQLWLWCAKNPEKDKCQWPYWIDYPEYRRVACFACGRGQKRSISENDTIQFCECPIKWKKTKIAASMIHVNNISTLPCEQRGTLYWKYKLYKKIKDYRKVSDIAYKISTLTWDINK